MKPKMPQQTSAKVKVPDDDLREPELMFQELDGLLGYRLRRARCKILLDRQLVHGDGRGP